MFKIQIDQIEAAASKIRAFTEEDELRKNMDEIIETQFSFLGKSNQAVRFSERRSVDHCGTF